MGTTGTTILNTKVKESASEPTSLLHDFSALHHSNVFSRAFSFAADQLPITTEKQAQISDRVLLTGETGFIFQLYERELKVPARTGDIEKWVSGQVVKKGARRIQATRELLASYSTLSVVNHFGHRMTLSPRNPDSLIGVVVFRVPVKTKPFRAARFKQNRNGGFVHILRDTDYFEICQHFVSPTELADYFAFRRDMLVGWDPPTTAVSERALIGQYLLEDFASPPSSSLERAARSRGGATASEFSFVLDSLAGDIARLEEDPEEHHEEDWPAGEEPYAILSEIASLSRYELRALKDQLRNALEAVRVNRFELPLRVASPRTKCGFLILPVMREFQDRAFEALESLAMASKHELSLAKQVGIGMWKDGEFVDIEWIYMAGDNPPQPEIDARLAQSYPFRLASDRRLPPVFT
jgi:hypothetical protein